MPSSGLPSENFLPAGAALADINAVYERMRDVMHRASLYGLEREWLECFVGAWNATHDIYQALEAGPTEWDL